MDVMIRNGVGVSIILSENSRRLWLFLGSVREFWRKVPGKFRENCWKKISRIAKCYIF